ncbi:hypothetical protein PGTUg99_031106 [Puccinia graminis f. sp. tritici]|uniref:Uncharacterized protein n=1 Tax=Puccinia graminis f. sp. tritici TaxID=56615 RepID=A0A5B0P2Q2_PUCGR|nr:hypothetical protein PGTUg99_031106 [Puccinia graminis f. sp. tritici]
MTEPTQPPQALKRGLDSHTPSTTDPMDIKARPGQRKRRLKIPSGIPLKYRGVGRVAVTEEGLLSLSEYLPQSLPPTSIPAQTTTPKLR